MKSRVRFLLFPKKSAYPLRTVCFLCLTGVLFFQNPTFSAQTATEPKPFQFSGIITATNNGISIIPSFTLGRPAVFFDLSIGGERLSFDPMLRFGMDGKPWSFVFWGRYKVIKDSRFTLNVGAHPTFIFQERTFMVDGQEETMMAAQRIFAGEIAPMYKVSERFSVGFYYLQGRGFNPIPPKNTIFLALNTVFSNLPIYRDVKLRMNPQVYFLQVDENTGSYVVSSFTLTKKDFPIGIQTLFNQKIKSQVAGDDLVWNVGLVYNFSKEFNKAKN
ncbi:hypothetical protein [Algoriphagus sp.]|uniref:hypothetical protein n=1 Tax=Algoriphagus sp. TaxID=1872435 RepID=UPI00391C0902